MMDNFKSAVSVTAVIIWPDFVFSDILRSFLLVVTEAKVVLSDMKTNDFSSVLIRFYSSTFISLFSTPLIYSSFSTDALSRGKTMRPV